MLPAEDPALRDDVRDADVHDVLLFLFLWAADLQRSEGAGLRGGDAMEVRVWGRPLSQPACCPSIYQPLLLLGTSVHSSQLLRLPSGQRHTSAAAGCTMYTGQQKMA